MGKRIIPQRRGKGSPTYEAKHTGLKARYVKISDQQTNSAQVGQVTDLMKEAGRDSILMQVTFGEQLSSWTIAKSTSGAINATLAGTRSVD